MVSKTPDDGRSVRIEDANGRGAGESILTPNMNH